MPSGILRGRRNLLREVLSISDALFDVAGGRVACELVDSDAGALYECES